MSEKPMINNTHEFFFFLSAASLLISCLLFMIIQFSRHGLSVLPTQEGLFGELSPFEKKLAKWGGIFFLFFVLFLAIGFYIWF
jgi:hypothetical protein